LSEARSRAAEEHYLAAQNCIKTDTRLSWKEAYYHFQQADCYVPGYKDVEEGMKTAKFYATWKVIVEQISVPRNYQLSSDFFLNQVIEALNNERPNEFVIGQFIWFTEWSNFNGDERALSKDQLAMCSKKPVPPPRP
jgi:hypothetical protein